MSRPRANTGTLSSFSNWRRSTARPEHVHSPPVSIDELISSLTPPTVPSLAAARALANAVASTSSEPIPIELLAIISTLCSRDSPIAIQAAGFEVLAAYCDREDSPIQTMDRREFFRLFEDPVVPWSTEIWEPRFKALRSLSKQGAELIGYELRFVSVLKMWIRGAFEAQDAFERHRSIQLLADLLHSSIKDAPRIPDSEILHVLQFHQELVDWAIEHGGRAVFDQALDLYLEYYKQLPPYAGHSAILPLLFRAMSFCARPLARLSINQATDESPLVTTVMNLLSGPYASTCTVILKNHLYPDGLDERSLRTSHGAHRTLRLFIRTSLHRLLVRAYINREASVGGGYNHTGVGAGQMDSIGHILESAWPKPDTFGYGGSYPGSGSTAEGWDAQRVGKLLSGSATAWVDLSLLEPNELVPGWREKILEEVASTTRDILQELDSRGDDDDGYTSSVPTLDEAEACAIGETLYCLARVVKGIRSSDGTPYILPLSLPNVASSPLLILIAGLLARDSPTVASPGPSQALNRPSKNRSMSFGSYSAKSGLAMTVSSPLTPSLSCPVFIPSLTQTLLQIADHLSDEDTSKLVWGMVQKGDGGPGGELGELLGLGNPSQSGIPPSVMSLALLVSSSRPATIITLAQALSTLYESVRDMPLYRKGIGDFVLGICEGDDPAIHAVAHMQGIETFWKIMGDETVLRAEERSRESDEAGVEEEDHSISRYLDTLVDLAFSSQAPPSPNVADDVWPSAEEEETDNASIYTISRNTHTPTHPPLLNSHNRSKSANSFNFISPSSSSTFSPNSNISPSQSRDMSSDRDKDTNGMPSVMSLLSSFTKSPNSNSPSHVSSSSLDTHDTVLSPEIQGRFANQQAQSPLGTNGVGNAGVGAVSSLVSVFEQLAFMPSYSVTTAPMTHEALLYKVYQALVRLITPPSKESREQSPSCHARLAALQFLMQLRADRDHVVYFIGDDTVDIDGQIQDLAALIGRVAGGDAGSSLERDRDRRGDGGRPSAASTGSSFGVDPTSELRKARPRFPERDREASRVGSRGRGGIPLPGVASRSRSRTGIWSTPTKTPSTSSESPPLWMYPCQKPFTVSQPNIGSSFLIVYDPLGPNRIPVLPISLYFSALIDIIEIEQSWDILSYVLCHLPAQLSNKHLLCGPKCRAVIARLLTLLCQGILGGQLAASVQTWPNGLKIRDAHGLAYHILSVLISYRRCFEIPHRHLLVETFLSGLSSTPSTVKISLHCLSIAAFDLQSSLTRFLSQILEKLSQIMSSPDVAVHILSLLFIIGSLPPLYANFTESEFKMVFGVALQYLQLHKRMRSSNESEEGGSWALSEHVRIISYCLVYVWFLAVKLPDRPRHIPFITRQLLLANEGNDQIDDATEVCFDWLARYSYASADPRPANSLLGDIIMNPGASAKAEETSISEKSWVLGNSIVTIRTLTRLGWMEVLSRRPSGYTKFLCRVENAPMVGPGDVDPDILSGPASLLMERNPPSVQGPEADPDGAHLCTEDIGGRFFIASEEESDAQPPVPDPITGYVWSRSAPSQRRKEVVIDPAFFALQLSAYPERLGPSGVRMAVPSQLLPKFVSSLDRIPVIDTHKVGILYVAPGQTEEAEILSNTHGSPAYTRFLEGIGRLINLRGQLDVYAGGLDPDEDGQYAYAWWDDIGQVLYHTATMMPARQDDPNCTYKKRHIGNDFVRIVWNDSGIPYRFDTLSTDFQFANIVIEPHSLGAIAAFSNNFHENEYFKVTVQGAERMPEFTPIGQYKLISAENLPLLVRQLSLLGDWFASVFSKTKGDTEKVEVKTNWQVRLEAIRRFKESVRKTNGSGAAPEAEAGIISQEIYRDFTTLF
ncbi:hypothetical protein C8J56DRAFT_949352 [Mycena floridula]|nr:hypothetical protein C8J56DRAFT_949352 [Mycena floridula]